MGDELALLTESIVIPADQQEPFMEALSAAVRGVGGSILGGELRVPWTPEDGDELTRLRAVEDAARRYVASDPPRPEWKALCDALGIDWRQS